jgi:hypothetical protein
VQGGPGNDTLNGAADGDTVQAGTGDDFVDGDDGNDTLRGDAGSDSLDGGNGTDTANYGPGATEGANVDLGAGTVSDDGTGSGDASITGVENLKGTGFGDTLTGDTAANRLSGAGGADNLLGGAGNDTLTGGVGNDFFEGEDDDDLIQPGPGSNGEVGGNGTDTLDYAGLSAGVSVDLPGGTSLGGASDYVISGFENLKTTTFDDTIDWRDVTVASVVSARGGDDTINVNDGDNADTVDGGTGTNHCTRDGGDALTNCL